MILLMMTEIKLTRTGRQTSSDDAICTEMRVRVGFSMNKMVHVTVIKTKFALFSF